MELKQRIENYISQKYSAVNDVDFSKASDYIAKGYDENLSFQDNMEYAAKLIAIGKAKDIF